MADNLVWDPITQRMAPSQMANVQNIRMVPDVTHSVNKPGSTNTFNTFDSAGNNIGSYGQYNTDFSFDGMKGNAMAAYDDVGDFFGSKGFANGSSALGAGLGAWFNYQKMENERKYNDKMFDLQEGQINRSNKLMDKTQGNYNAGSTKTP